MIADPTYNIAESHFSSKFMHVDCLAFSGGRAGATIAIMSIRDSQTTRLQRMFISAPTILAHFPKAGIIWCPREPSTQSPAQAIPWHSYIRAWAV